MPILVRIGRFLLKTAGVLLVLFFLLVLLVNLPFVQDQITEYAESYLRKQTNTSIRVEKISINFRGNLLIRDMLVPDRQQDTLLHLGKLEVGFQLREIIQKKIRIKSVELEDVLVDSFIKELGFGAGLGFRMNINPLALRLDLAIPLTKPWLPEGQR